MSLVHTSEPSALLAPPVAPATPGDGDVQTAAAPQTADSAAADTPGSLQVSVVVPTCGRPQLLGRCLLALQAQTLPRGQFEVIVVDDQPSEVTRSLVTALAAEQPTLQLRYLRPLLGRGPAVARNCGWRAAQAALVAFTDDDTLPDAQWLAQGLEAMQSGSAVAVAGRVVVPRPEGASGPPTDHELMTQGLERTEFVTANAFVRTRALVQVGGFDERFTRAWREDSDLQFRLQALPGGVGRCETAQVLHPVRAERWGVSLRQQKNAFFEALIYSKHPQIYRQRLRPHPPWGYYVIVLFGIGALASLLMGQWMSAAMVGAVSLAGMLRLAWRRLRGTSHAPGHVLEMLATSALIPFLSVWWRLRGALHFRVPFF